VPDPHPANHAATRRSYDAVAADYTAAIGAELRGKPLDRALLDVLAEQAAGETVLDAGCGPGHVAAYLRGRGVRVVVGDLSSAMCRTARDAHGLPAFAGDLTALPLRDASLGAAVCFYAVIHLDGGLRRAAYRELARALRPGGHLLLAFHTGDADTSQGGSRRLREWWGHEVDLTFHFLDPGQEATALESAGFTVTARLDRRPDPATEHPSERTYLLSRR
jgi:SAM-dependent methyltransferase